MAALPANIRESIRAINEGLPRNETPVSTNLVAAAFAFAQKGFAENLLTHYRWAQYPERPSEAYRSLVNPAIVTSLSQRHQGRKSYSQYVFDNNPPYSARSAASGRSDDFETKYDLKHHLKTAWTDRSGMIVSELIMYPGSDKRPGYTFGQYYEYQRDGDGRITGYIYAPLKETGEIDQHVWQSPGGLHNRPVLVEAVYRNAPNKNVAIISRKVLSTGNISDINDESIAGTVQTPILKEGHIYYLKGQGKRQLSPVVDNFGRVKFDGCEEVRFDYGENDLILIVESDSNWKHLENLGIPRDQVSVKEPESKNSVLKYIQVPASLFT